MQTMTGDRLRAHRDRFLERVVAERHVFMVAGEDGVARVGSAMMRGREVAMLWSSAEDPERLAHKLVANPRIKRLTLSEMLSSVLPGLAQHRRLAGLDWTELGPKVELDPAELADRIRSAALDRFVRLALERGRICTLEDAGGPALLVSKTRPNGLVLPCWSEPGEAFARCEGPWRDMMVLEIPVAEFCAVKLPWLAKNGHLVGPENDGGAGAFELDAEDLRQRLAPSTIRKPLSA